MSDISMCNNTDCPSRHHCYRFTATACSFRQAYGDFKVVPPKQKCDFYWPDKQSRQQGD